MDAAPYTHHRDARSRGVTLVLALVYTALIGAVLWIDAAPWLMTLLALPTLPALYEQITNPAAGIELTAGGLRWFTGRRAGTLRLAEIGHMRFDTRWDLSVRVTAVLRSGKSVRLPWEALPPHRVFERELTARGIAVERHHFRVF